MNRSLRYFLLGAGSAAAGIAGPFVQDNHSHSALGILRGLHFQSPRAQGKLVRVASGAVFDVVVDIRADSPTFAAWFGIELSAENHLMLWAPGARVPDPD